MRYSRFITLAVFCGLFLISGCNLPGSGDLPAPTPTSGLEKLIPSQETLPASEITREAETENCANDYYPVVTGASWTYTGNNSTGISFRFTRTITNTSGEGFAELDVWDGGVTRTGTWTCADGDLTALNQGGVATVSVPTGEDRPKLEAESVKSDGVSIPAEMKLDESWEQSINLTGKMTLLQGGMTVAVTNDAQITCTPISVENVSVPAGSFEAIKVVCASSLTVTIDNNAPGTISGTLTLWYVAGVGIVKIMDESEVGSATIELAEYTVPVVAP